MSSINYKENLEIETAAKIVAAVYTNPKLLYDMANATEETVNTTKESISKIAIKQAKDLIKQYYE